jgi:hypothetical protein
LFFKNFILVQLFIKNNQNPLFFVFIIGAPPPPPHASAHGWGAEH